MKRLAVSSLLAVLAACTGSAEYAPNTTGEEWEPSETTNDTLPLSAPEASCVVGGVALDCLAASDFSGWTAGSPANRINLFRSDTVQKSEVGCQAFAQLLYSECRPATAVTAFFSSPTTQSNSVIEKTTALRASLAEPFPTYLAGGTVPVTAGPVPGLATRSRLELAVRDFLISGSAMMTAVYPLSGYVNVTRCGLSFSPTLSPDGSWVLVIRKEPLYLNGSTQGLAAKSVWCNLSEQKKTITEALDQLDADVVAKANLMRTEHQTIDANFQAFAKMPLLNQVNANLQGLDLEKYNYNYALDGQCLATANAMTILGLKSISPHSQLGNAFDDPSDSQVTTVGYPRVPPLPATGGTVRRLYGEHAVHIDTAAQLGSAFQNHNDSATNFAERMFSYWPTTVQTRSCLNGGTNPNWYDHCLPGSEFAWLSEKPVTVIPRYGGAVTLQLDNGMLEVQYGFKKWVAAGRAATLIVHNVTQALPWRAWESDVGHAMTLNGMSGDNLIVFDPWGIVDHLRPTQWQFPGHGTTISCNGTPVVVPTDSYWVLQNVGTGYPNSFIGYKTYTRMWLNSTSFCETAAYPNVAFVMGYMVGVPYDAKLTANERLQLKQGPYSTTTGGTAGCTNSAALVTVNGRPYYAKFENWKGQLAEGQPHVFGCRAFRAARGAATLSDFVGTVTATCNGSALTISDNTCAPLPPVTRACPIAHGTGIQTLELKRLGTAVDQYYPGTYGSCVVATCEAGYTKSMNSCIYIPPPPPSPELYDFKVWGISTVGGPWETSTSIVPERTFGGSASYYPASETSTWQYWALPRKTSFMVRLASAPTADQTVPIRVLDQYDTTSFSGAVASVTSLTFTPANWSVGQPVTITGVDNTVQQPMDSGLSKRGTFFDVVVGGSNNSNLNRTVEMFLLDNERCPPGLDWGYTTGASSGSFCCPPGTFPPAAGCISGN